MVIICNLMFLFTFWKPTWVFCSSFSNNIFYAHFISPKHISLPENHHYICHRNCIGEQYKLILPRCATHPMFSFFDLKRRLFQYWPTRSVYKFYDCSTLSKQRHSGSVSSTGMSKPCRLVNVVWRLDVSFFQRLWDQATTPKTTLWQLGTSGEGATSQKTWISHIITYVTA